MAIARTCGLRPATGSPRLSDLECALARGHCLPDGNKRVAPAIIDVFLRLNGLELTADELDAVDTIRSLAAGDLTEKQLADRIAADSAPLRWTPG